MTTIDRHNLLWRTATLRPRITVGTAGRALPAPVAGQLVRVVVDTQARVPDMFELTFADVDGDVLRTSGLDLGTAVQVFGPSQDGSAEHRLISGEVTALEGRFVDLDAYVVVRGYTHDHRLHRVRRTRTFLNQKDSDIARQVASAAKLSVGTIDATAGTLAHLSQVDQTDWEFLSGRAREIGYEIGADGEKFHFRRAATARAAGSPLPLTFRGNLRRFLPRVSAGNLAPEVEVRAWDPVAATVVASRTATTADGVSLAGRTPAAAADTFVPRGAPAPPAGNNAVGDVGPAPGPRAHVLVGRGLPVPGRADGAVAQVAASLAGSVGGSFAEAEGEALGDARLVAGRAVRIDGIPAPFAGTWTLTAARHVFDETEDGYRTEFTVGGTQDRSLLGLTDGGPAADGPARIDGVVCGVVSNVKDPQNLGRVKLALPWLAPDHETDWAPVGQLFAGPAGGAFFVPEPGDQVLVAFEFGDVRRPYVLGSLPSRHTGYGLDGAQTSSTKPGATGVKSVGQTSSVIRRGLISPSGSRLVFHDEVPPGGKGQPTAADLVLGTKGDKLGLAMDQVAGTVTLRCAPDRPGKLLIECTGQTAVEIKAGPGGSLTLDGGTSLKLKGKTVDIDGTQVNIRGTAATAIKGKPIQLN
ncbi:phage baseplate assembly protein V [Polymorphospora rubra]|uniref:Type IV secretion protein Rhs n=1 Tax=Polymorphospora rubra TaxID=338584 RepID=A0A810MW97_9ACTN|nr:phage baseplate assembly protein V [Polymorphospora rubra]BCJ63903.1 type IV secretion protein Rhs [Polymorphospora rubra]